MQSEDRFDHWLYASRSALPPSDASAGVDVIVDQSRARNAALGITGALIFTGGFFAQYVEGPADAIAALKNSILADPRHFEVRTVTVGQTRERKFHAWALAYSEESWAFDRLVMQAHKIQASSGETLLMEMIRRFVGRLPA